MINQKHYRRACENYGRIFFRSIYSIKKIKNEILCELNIKHIRLLEEALEPFYFEQIIGKIGSFRLKKTGLLLKNFN